MYGNSGISLADIAAVTGGNKDGFGGGNGWWVLVILFALFGGFGNGFGNNGGQGALTRGDLCQDMNFSDLEGAVRGVNQGLCDGFYAMNTGMLNGFHGVDNAVCQLGYTIQGGFNALQAQQAQCCCDTREAISQVRYDMGANTCALTTAMNQGFAQLDRTISDQFCQLKMEQKDAKIAEQASLINALNLAQSQANQNQYLLDQIRAMQGGCGCGCN